MTEPEIEARRLEVKLQAYRLVKAGARVLRERLESRQDETFFLGARRKPVPPLDRQTKLRV